LILVLGVKQLVFLVVYFNCFRIDYMRFANDARSLIIYCFPQLAGSLAALALFFFRRPQLEQQTPFTLLFVERSTSARRRGLLVLSAVLLLSALNGPGDEFAPMERTLVNFGPFALAAAALLFAILPAAQLPPSLMQRRAFVHWAGIFVCTLPLIWFLVWMWLGYVRPHFGFVHRA